MSPKKQAMIEAMEQQLGVVTAACKQAGISRWTHYNWLKEDPEYKQAIEHIPDVCLDFAENVLFKAMKEGNITSAIFYLKTKGKKRGYIERVEQENIQTEPSKLILYVDDSDDGINSDDRD